MARRQNIGLTPQIKETILASLNGDLDKVMLDSVTDVADRRETGKQLAAAIAYVDSLAPASERTSAGSGSQSLDKPAAKPRASSTAKAAPPPQ